MAPANRREPDAPSDRREHPFTTIAFGLIGTLLAAALIGAVTMKENASDHNADIRLISTKLEDLKIIACDDNPRAAPCRRSPNTQ
jgi:hypothetical protein